MGEERNLMAGEWVKMRMSLTTDPRVNGIARFLEDDRAVGKVLSAGFNGAMSEIVTRGVMRDVTVASLLRVWGAANEHTRDGAFLNSDLSDIDDIAGIPGFGTAMESVGWAIYDEQNDSVTLPNFNEYNTVGKERQRSQAAERQKRYREKKKGDAIKSDEKNNATRDATRDVTSNDREEKRREEDNSLSTGADARESESTPMPPDWQPSDMTLEQCRQARCPPVTDDHVVMFRAHHAERWLTETNRQAWFLKWMVREKVYSAEGRNTGGASNGNTNTAGTDNGIPKRSVHEWAEAAKEF